MERIDWIKTTINSIFSNNKYFSYLQKNPSKRFNIYADETQWIKMYNISKKEVLEYVKNIKEMAEHYNEHPNKPFFYVREYDNLNFYIKERDSKSLIMSYIFHLERLKEDMRIIKRACESRDVKLNFV